MLNEGNKAFGTLNHNLLLCRLKIYGFNKHGLTFVQSYFTNRHQQTKVSLANGKRSQQAYPNAPFLVLYLNIFIKDLVIETTALCNDADDNIIYSLDKNSNIVITRGMTLHEYENGIHEFNIFE